MTSREILESFIASKTDASLTDQTHNRSSEVFRLSVLHPARSTCPSQSAKLEQGRLIRTEDERANHSSLTVMDDGGPKSALWDSMWFAALNITTMVDGLLSN